MSSAHVATPPLVSNFVSNSSALPPSSSSRVAVAMASELTVSLSLTATAAPEVTSTAAAVVLASSYTWLELLLRFTIVSYPDRVLPALWFALGVPSNVLCVHVWLLRQLRHSSSIYLAALAAADLAQLLLYVPTYLESRFLIVPPSYYGVCELYNVLHVTVQYIPPCLMIVFSAGALQLVLCSNSNSSFPPLPYHLHLFSLSDSLSLSDFLSQTLSPLVHRALVRGLVPVPEPTRVQRAARAHRHGRHLVRVSAHRQHADLRLRARPRERNVRCALPEILYRFLVPVLHIYIHIHIHIKLYLSRPRRSSRRKGRR